MNARIKELAVQSEISRLEYNPDTMMTNRIQEFNKEKFAELIINECITLIRKQSIGEEIISGQHYKTVQLGETIATITEHFGVEE